MAGTYVVEFHNRGPQMVTLRRGELTPDAGLKRRVQACYGRAAYAQAGWRPSRRERDGAGNTLRAEFKARIVCHPEGWRPGQVREICKLAVWIPAAILAELAERRRSAGPC